MKQVNRPHLPESHRPPMPIGPENQNPRSNAPLDSHRPPISADRIQERKQEQHNIENRPPAAGARPFPPPSRPDLRARANAGAPPTPTMRPVPPTGPTVPTTAVAPTGASASATPVPPAAPAQPTRPGENRPAYNQGPAQQAAPAPSDFYPDPYAQSPYDEAGYPEASYSTPYDQSIYAQEDYAQNYPPAPLYGQENYAEEAYAYDPYAPSHPGQEQHDYRDTYQPPYDQNRAYPAARNYPDDHAYRPSRNQVSAESYDEAADSWTKWIPTILAGIVCIACLVLIYLLVK